MHLAGYPISKSPGGSAWPKTAWEHCALIVGPTSHIGSWQGRSVMRATNNYKKPADGTAPRSAWPNSVRPRSCPKQFEKQDPDAKGRREADLFCHQAFYKKSSACIPDRPDLIPKQLQPRNFLKWRLSRSRQTSGSANTGLSTK